MRDGRLPLMEGVEMKIGDTWIGKPPTKCDICERSLALTFVDGRTSDGRWGIMCPNCRISEGRINLGTGLGQKFERNPGGPWVKTQG
jgi:hypothetical protein